MPDRYKCPVYECSLKLTPEELEAHLAWDHSWNSLRAEREVDHIVDD